MVNTRSFLVLGLSLIAGLTVFGMQIGRAVRKGREFDRCLTVRGLAEREVKSTLAIWPIRFSVSADDLGSLKTAMEKSRDLVAAFLMENGIESTEVNQGLPGVCDREDEKSSGL